MITGIDMDFFGKPTVFLDYGPEECSYTLSNVTDELSTTIREEVLESVQENIALAVKVLDYYGINPIEFINDLV